MHEDSWTYIEHWYDEYDTMGDLSQTTIVDLDECDVDWLTQDMTCEVRVGSLSWGEQEAYGVTSSEQPRGGWAGGVNQSGVRGSVTVSWESA